MATINLGAIKFNWKGAYNNSTQYQVDDVVSSGGSSYVCIQASQGNAVGNATAYWNIMSSAGTNGTNGTDVGTTLTTQGDMLYRDGSGLQRLPKGTAGQDLRMNSGATAPEWYTSSGGGILQMKQYTYTGTSDFNNAAYAAIQSGFKVDITPTAADSKFLLQACLNIGFPNHDSGGGFGFIDSQVGSGDSNVIPTISSGSNNRTPISIGGVGSWAAQGDVENYLTVNVHISTMYTPSSQNTNQRTFHVAGKRNSYNSTLLLNYGQTNNGLTNVGVSTMTVMEVANSIT